MTQRQFFATPKDLQPVFDLAEAIEPFSLALMGLFDAPELHMFPSASKLPSLSQPAASQSQGCPTYLITPVGSQVAIRSVRQEAGGVKYAVDQLENPDSAALTHGGFFVPGVLISGRIATASVTPVGKRIFLAYSNAIGKLFIKFKAFYVGPEAFRLLRDGCRLTFNANAPAEYDLERPHSDFVPSK
jgi:hypothetical protein